MTRHWPDDLAAYEATFDDEPPVEEKLAALDRLAVEERGLHRRWTWFEWSVLAVLVTLLTLYYYYVVTRL